MPAKNRPPSGTDQYRFSYLHSKLYVQFVKKFPLAVARIFNPFARKKLRLPGCFAKKDQSIGGERVWSGEPGKVSPQG